MKFLRNLGKRNMFNTNYKVYAIHIQIPVIGNSINNCLFKHGLSDSTYKKDYHNVIYLRRWYRKERDLKRKELIQHVN